MNASPRRRVAALAFAGIVVLALTLAAHPAAAQATTGTAPVTVTLTAPSTAPAGSPFTLHASVSPTGNPGGVTGSVTFLDGTAQLGTVTFQGNPAADLTASLQGLGTHHLSASYSGDGLYAPATSATSDVVVTGPTPVTVTLVSRTNPCVPGQEIFLDAWVDTPPGMPWATGTVTFQDGGTPLLVVPLDNQANASMRVVLDSSGPYNHALTAVYSGDSQFAAGTSVTLQEDVFSMSPTARFVHQLYNDILYRPEDTGYLESEIDWGHMTRGQAAGSLAYSKEHVTDVVVVAYLKYLSRDPDPQGLNYWVTRIMYGLTSTMYPGEPPLATDEQLELSFLTSPEYVKASGGGAGLVQSLYNDILTRAPDPAGLAYWSQRLSAGTPPAELASLLLYSDESMRDRVTDVYVQILWRMPDLKGLNYWSARLEHGARDEDLITLLAGSDEYYARTQVLSVAASSQ